MDAPPRYSVAGHSASFSVRPEKHSREATALNFKPLGGTFSTKYEVTLDEAGKPFMSFKQKKTARNEFIVLDQAGLKIAVLERKFISIFESRYTLWDEHDQELASMTGIARAKDCGFNDDEHAAEVRTEVFFNNAESSARAMLVIKAKCVEGEDTNMTLGEDHVVARFSCAPSRDKPFTVICDGGVDLLLVAASSLATGFMVQEARGNFSLEGQAARRKLHFQQKQLLDGSLWRDQFWMVKAPSSPP